MYSDTRICLRDHNLVKLLLYIFARLKRVLNILVLTGMAGICTTNCNYPLFMDYLNIIYYLPLLHHIKINEGLYLIIGLNLYITVQISISRFKFDYYPRNGVWGTP